ncbi:ATP phosphoribosyltransferase [Luteipulveratus flavus]|uniref:ATP phosphoribosyltransferase n=1 Tax=Luteipulveratus flavus TaxID=3031728 RepID=A0ABT6C5S6_9MICO|nr:ATP phosphoribosyltransferase [Luteipulveratus sp. YIM 133296]MDF8264130.1 ATP phosphoribosyltransferase [Luteipulveratus sp. YIM 133296]
MLKVAVPNKGALADSAAAMLREAGYRGRRESKELVVRDADNDVEFFYLRPRDIAVYVGSGTLDVGLTGRDLLLDSGSPAEEILPLGFGRSTFRYAGRPGVAADVTELAGRRIATSFSGLVEADLAKHGIEAGVVRLDGAVETAVTLGVADVIADVVETGTTLRNAGLEVFGEPILSSEAVLIRPAGSPENPRVDVLVRRLQGVLTARHYVMMDYDVRVELVEQACALTPGLESPTVSPLHDKGYVAVRSMVPRQRTNQVMDDLYDLGARAILVTDIAACRI